ncbi:septal ring lytic transglycosylase RlpA family protein [Henriciella sp. AS95]|uniref:septal ring lytic transglycosylase RlpA family protein n=1 Tax=Henriciella sp. AS95 TaxID=3135782 RepID=UPI00317EBC9C
MASIESTPRATQPARTSSPAWPDASTTRQPALQTAGAPRSLVLGAKASNTLSAQRPEPVTPDFLQATSEETGLASWYGEAFHGNQTANGETFDMYAMTAAHRTLPLPSLVQVINEENGKEIVVRVNDRGPFIDDRIIDLSMKAASALDIIDQGEAEVTVRYLGPAPAVERSPVMVAEATSPTTQALPPIVPVDAEAKPRTDLYGDILMGGMEPSLGIPDPGQAVATPARIAIATPPASKPDLDLTPAPVREAALPTPQRLQVSATPNNSSSAPKFQPKIFVQVGSFADISNAQGMDAQVGRQFPVDIESVRVQGADYFRVLVGPFPTRSAADMAKYQLSQRGIKDGFVVLR